MKTVYKPWGTEVWIELNDWYCYKRIYIKQGHRTSFQYHEKKRETNYIIQGDAELWLENESGYIEKRQLGSDDHFTVFPLRKHRIIAKTDLILQEVSTPEVDDVIRVEDDTHREDGRIEHEHKQPAVCILAAGKGSRLKNIGEEIHKALLPIENKAVISHLIEKIPPDFDIIVATNYLEEMVQDYCNAAHPDRHITYVHVEHAEGPGSGPGMSLYACRELLQRPFLVTVSDCLIKGNLPDLDGDWIGIYPTGIPELYSTAKLDEHMKVVEFINKSSEGFDFAFVGLCHVQNYELFWHQLEKHLGNGELVDVFVDTEGFPVTARLVDWVDVGTVDNYMQARGDLSLVKEDEYLYKVHNRCIKLYVDPTIVSGRVYRARILEGLVPKIKFASDYLYAYEWVDGNTLYELNDIDLMTSFLDWYLDEIYSPVSDDIEPDCYRFYHDKTIERTNKFVDSKNICFQGSHIINGRECVNISEYLQMVDWKCLSDGTPISRFHGDLQFDNILYTKASKFVLLDWRQSFGQSQDYGDVYYDLAKLYGGILIPYHLMKDERNFDVQYIEGEVCYSHSLPAELIAFRPIFEAWVRKRFDFDRIKLLTSLIFLNMSPLHPGAFGELLFFCAKRRLHAYFNKQRH